MTEEQEQTEEEEQTITKAKNQFIHAISTLVNSGDIAERATGYDLGSGKIITDETSKTDPLLIQYIKEAEEELIHEMVQKVIKRAGDNIKNELKAISRMLL